MLSYFAEVSEPLGYLVHKIKTVVNFSVSKNIVYTILHIDKVVSVGGMCVLRWNVLLIAVAHQLCEQTPEQGELGGDRT